MLRGIWGDPERYRDTYWSRFDGKYFAGDGAKRDDEGYFWLLGRVDDIMLVVGPQHLARPRSSRRSSTTRRWPRPRSSARTTTTTGQAIAAFVILRGGNEPNDALVDELRDHVAKLIGPIAKPKSILFTEELPKTRSGKIMRRLLRDVAEDQALGDTTTLADPSVVDGIKARYLVEQPDRGVARHACGTLPEHWTWRDGADHARPRGRRRHRRRALRRVRAASTTSRRPAATGGRSSTRAVTTR